MKTQRTGGRLFWRIYIHGIGLLLLTAIAVAVVGNWTPPAMQQHRHRRFLAFAALLDRVISASKSDDPYLNKTLEGLPIDVTVFDRDGVRIASNVDPPLPNADQAAREEAARGDGALLPRHHQNGVILLPQSNSTLVWRPIFVDDGLLQRVLTTILITLAILAVLSLPLARRIARPIDTLVQTAQRIGNGDLSARTGLARGNDIGDLAQAFDAMAERIERLLRSEKELLANVSHELRTPLARMRVAMELASDGDADAARKYLAEVTIDIDELERLIDDVLTTARLDHQNPSSLPPLRLENTTSQRIANDVVERFERAHPQRSLELNVGSQGLELLADRVLVRRALDNLLDNAVKYSDGAVTFAVSTNADTARFEIRDRGHGIPPEDLARLFTPFFRADSSRSRDTGGFGLGLALARRIAEAHGGTLTVDSTVGHGSSFVLTLPAPAADLPGVQL